MEKEVEGTQDNTSAMSSLLRGSSPPTANFISLMNEGNDELNMLAENYVSMSPVAAILSPETVIAGNNNNLVSGVIFDALQRTTSE